jgi:hypothetical protein
MAISDLIHNIEIMQGSLFPLTIIVTDDDDVVIPLTGYVVFCEIRDRPGGSLIASPTISVTPASGQIYISLTPAQTKEIGAERGVYDVLIVDQDDQTNVRPVLMGEVKIWPQVTKLEVTLSGGTHSGTDVIDIANTTGLVVGMAISGTGIGVGALIASIDTNHIHATVVSTATATVSLTFTA